MIRNTANQGIIADGKLSGSKVGNSQSIESVDTIFGLMEVRDIDIRVDGQSQTPSSRHTGNLATVTTNWAFGSGTTILYGSGIVVQA